MLCAEIMKTDVECILPTDTVETAASKMREGNLGFLPVCDDEQKVLGAITDRDIAVRLVAEHKPGSTQVQEIMTTECIACSSEDELEDAERLMARYQKSRIMCVDDEGCVIGVISLSDIAKLGNGAAETLREISTREA